MKLTILRAAASGALLAGALAFTSPLALAAQTQSSTTAGTTSGPASANTSGKWTNNGASGSTNAAAGNGHGAMIGGAAGHPAKTGSEAGPAPHKATSSGASGTNTMKQP